jgi:Holliday junction resolvase RusA-like endonuclease
VILLDGFGFPVIQFEVIGKPVSVNAAYRRGNGMRLYKTREATVWQREVMVAAMEVMKGDPPTKKVDLYITIEYWFRTRACDVGNYDKLILDAMEAIVFGNDNCVQRLILIKNIDKENPRVRITVSQNA